MHQFKSETRAAKLSAADSPPPRQTSKMQSAKISGKIREFCRCFVQSFWASCSSNSLHIDKKDWPDTVSSSCLQGPAPLRCKDFLETAGKNRQHHQLKWHSDSWHLWQPLYHPWNSHPLLALQKFGGCNGSTQGLPRSDLTQNQQLQRCSGHPGEILLLTTGAIQKWDETATLQVLNCWFCCLVTTGAIRKWDDSQKLAKLWSWYKPTVNS